MFFTGTWTISVFIRCVILGTRYHVPIIWLEVAAQIHTASLAAGMCVLWGPQNINSLKISIRLSKGNLPMVAFLLRLIIYIHWYFAVIYLIMICHFLQPTIFLRQFWEQMIINPLVLLCNLCFTGEAPTFWPTMNPVVVFCWWIIDERTWPQCTFILLTKLSAGVRVFGHFSIIQHPSLY